jgi:hypothetical protein
MKSSVLSFLFLMFLMGGAASALAQDSKWQKLNDEAMSLYEKGDAVLVAKKALEFAEKFFGDDHPDVVTSMNSLAELYNAQGKNELAEPFYERILRILEMATAGSIPKSPRS